MEKYIDDLLKDLENKYEHEPEYLQATKEILTSLEPFVKANDDIKKYKVLERFVEPERVIMFRVVWQDDNNNIQVNRGYRVQFNSAIGPYKGGLRFHPSVNLSILKFLGLEQTLKNSLTGLPMGGAKGGSDFDPKNKSDNEIMRFCQAYMNELYRHIGQFTDIPAGDIGVGQREIGYLYGQYKKLTNQMSGALTGKGLSYGGSLVRKEATGYGLIYFTNMALNTLKNESLKDKTVVISGSGNVAIYACQKAIEYGAKVVAMSDSNGYIYDENGINLDIIKQIKEIKRGRIKEYIDYVKTSSYYDNPKKIWSIKCDIALPCATQNEIGLDEAKCLINNKVMAVCEGANMPSTIEAQKLFIKNNIVYGPAKASNAGGVATSGIEMTQNSIRYSYDFDTVDKMLKNIMENIFKNIYNEAKLLGNPYDLLSGANIYVFKRVYEAMIAEGLI